MKKQICLLVMIGLFALLGCEKKKADRIPISKKEYQKRYSLAAKKCPAFCKVSQSLCKDYLAKKKRVWKLKQCLNDCINSFVRKPSAVSVALGCVSYAKNCDQVRSCNRCGRLKCKKPTTRPSSRPAAKGKSRKQKAASKPSKRSK